MLVVIICRSMIVSVVGISHRVKRIHFPAKIIPVSAGGFKHLFLSKIVRATRKLNFYFDPVEQKCYCKHKKYTFKYRLFPFTNPLNNYKKICQHKSMTPHKLDYFLRSIQRMLKFVNGRYLHGQQQFYLIKIRIAQILLKIYKLNGAIPGFSQYSRQNNNTIGTTV